MKISYNHKKYNYRILSNNLRKQCYNPKLSKEELKLESDKLIKISNNENYISKIVQKIFVNKKTSSGTHLPLVF